LHFLKIRSEPALQAWSEPLHKRRPHFFRAKNLAGDIPYRALLRRQMTNVFRKKIDLGASGFSIRSATARLTFSRHRPVILRDRHGFQHFAVKIVRKHSLEPQVVEWRIIRRRRLHRVYNERDQIVD
jgi:hypothetical protein